MHFLKDFLNQIQSLVADETLELNLSPEFSSDQNGYRKKIRDDILKKFNPQLSPEEISSVQNLESFPITKKIFFSISHHHELGGYSVASGKHGFDIELKSRITARIVQRISTADELSTAPDIKFIWCAKEAAFKALSPSVMTVSDFEVMHWESHHETGLWTYRVTSKKTLELSHNIGFVFQDKTQIYSIYFL